MGNHPPHHQDFSKLALESSAEPPKTLAIEPQITKLNLLNHTTSKNNNRAASQSNLLQTTQINQSSTTQLK
jgi:hypothetical protein